MKQTNRIKFIIGLAILIVIALFATSIVQIFFINKTRKSLQLQQQEIERLEKELDYFEEKLPVNPSEELTPTPNE